MFSFARGQPIGHACGTLCLPSWVKRDAMGVSAASTETVLPTLSGADVDRSGFGRRAWWMYLVAMALVTSGYAFAHVSGPAWLKGGLVFNLIGGLSVAALILGARRNALASRLPWYLLAVGQGLFVTSDVLASNYERLFGTAMPFPSLADAFHLAFYPFLVAGMLLLIRERHEHRDRGGLIDATIVTLALATLLWVYLIAPFVDDDALSLLTRLTSIAYPAMDILVLGVVARVAAGSHRREPAFVFLLSAAVVLLLSDAIHGYKLLEGGYETGGVVDTGWAIFYTLLGTAALHPSMRLLSTPGPEADGHLTRARLALLTCASLTVPLVIVVREALSEPLDLYVLVGASGVMFALVLLRMVGIVHRNEELAVQMVTLTEESARAQLEHQAFHDTLTGLPNRALFRNRVEHALAGQRRDRLPVAVLFLDVDDFKNVNDGLGHAAGDIVLREVGRRLEDCMRPVDTAARLGGDEFAILIRDTESELHAIEIAHRVMDRLEASIALEGRDVAIATSVGIAFSGQGMVTGADADELLRNADAAMYMAKENGKGHYQVFQPEMHAKALARLQLKTDIQRALDSGEFTLRYQPIMDLCRGDMAGMEALVRWEHPDRGTVQPLDFIPLLEDTGLIVPVGRHILMRGVRVGRAHAVAMPSRPAAVDGRQRVCLPTSAPRVHRRGPRGSAGDGHRPQQPDPGADRERDDAGHGAEPAAADGAAFARSETGDRRLRDRLLLAELHPPVPGRHPQDRPLFPGRSEPGDGRADRGDRPARADLQAEGRRRGNREPRAARAAARYELRLRSGLSLRRAAGGRGYPGDGRVAHGRARCRCGPVLAVELRPWNGWRLHLVRVRRLPSRCILFYSGARTPRKPTGNGGVTTRTLRSIFARASKCGVCRRGHRACNWREALSSANWQALLPC